MKSIAPVVGQKMPRNTPTGTPTPWNINVQPPPGTDPVTGYQLPARQSAMLATESLPSPDRIRVMGTANPRGVLQLAQRLEHMFAATGVPPHLKQRVQAMSTLARATELEHRQGLGLVWFLAVPLAAAVAAVVAGIGYGSYKVYNWIENEGPKIGTQISTEARDAIHAAGNSARWVMYLSVGAFALTGLSAAWKVWKSKKRRARRRRR